MASSSDNSNTIAPSLPNNGNLPETSEKEASNGAAVKIEPSNESWIAVAETETLRQVEVDAEASFARHSSVEGGGVETILKPDRIVHHHHHHHHHHYHYHHHNLSSNQQIENHIDHKKTPPLLEPQTSETLDSSDLKIEQKLDSPSVKKEEKTSLHGGIFFRFDRKTFAKDLHFMP